MKPCIRTAVIVTAAALSLCAVLPVRADTTTPTFDAARSAASAPADEYFGPLGLSVLGIRNSIAETTLRLDRAGTGDVAATKSVELIEESIHDWQSRYPADVWLPRMVYALHRAYRKIASAESMQRSVTTATWLISRYPSSREADTARADLADALTPPVAVRQVARTLDDDEAVSALPPPPPESEPTLPPYAHY